MNITQFIQRVRDELDDNSKLKYSDAEIVRHTDEQARSLCRVAMRANKEWSNFALQLQKEDARTLFTNTYEWRLPTWIDAVVRVYRREDSNGTGEDTFSPYNWATTAPPTLGQEIPKTDNTRRSGWTWEGQHTLRIWNWAATPELALEVVASPAPMFRMAIAAIPAPAVPSSFFLPVTLGTTDLGDLAFTEEGRYINAEVQVTGTASATDAKLGNVRRVVYSEPRFDDSGTRRHRIVLENDFDSNVAVGDTIETLIPVQLMHTQILLLKVVNACAIKKFNIDLQRSIGPVLAEEMAAYVEWASKPRDKSGPFFMLGSSRTRRPYDPDIRQFGYLQGAWQ